MRHLESNNAKWPKDPIWSRTGRGSAARAYMIGWMDGWIDGWMDGWIVEYATWMDA